MFHFPKLYALDLEDSTLLPEIDHSQAQYVLVDFYAPWCPHCQHFAPEFERIAHAAQSSAGNSSSQHQVDQHTLALSSSILSGTVDCVKFSHECTSWGVDGFPTLKWGKKEDWLARSVSKLQTIDVWPRTAESVAEWIGNQTHIHLKTAMLSRVDVMRMMHQGQSIPQAADPVSGQDKTVVDPWDVQLATALVLHNALSQHNFLQDKEKDMPRAALVDFVDLLALRFPEHGSQTHCRQSLKSLHRLLDSEWHTLGYNVERNGESVFVVDASAVEVQWQLCGLNWNNYSKGWHECRGTWPGKRGYTCGLWTTFHTLATQTEDQHAMKETQVVRSMIQHFFDCEECRDHFLQIPVTESDIATKRDAQLWWWNAHNVVNRRVGKLEEQYQDGDPEYPKMQWPSSKECPHCRETFTGHVKQHKSFLRMPATTPEGDVPLEYPTIPQAVEHEKWNLDEVVAFLDRTYR